MYMIHNLILVVCIAAALAVLLAAIWTLIGNKADAHGGIFSGHALPRLFDQHLSFRRRRADISVRTASERTLPGGWSMIHRAMRARHDIRLSAR